ncbi:Per1-like protein [Calycina marina]|uniref:Post-GPI attachment to proteins factor 3 n=1 Tax=Calycina marina TaxID=1763456 RepID=A0A9P8CGJ5_9HELO|nr:Per1-like protein [Calycina marina]
MILRQPSSLLLCCLLVGVFVTFSNASQGDRLDEFKECVNVCKRENCAPGKTTEIPFLHMLLLWDCPAECDYTCQHIITNQRVANSQHIVQFHGKWPFYRLLGMQEPVSVLFSIFNFIAHQRGLHKLKAYIPPEYSMRKYYLIFSYCGMASWAFSIIFHTRDFALTEQLDYFAAGGSVLYGLYYAAVRIFRLDKLGSRKESVLRAWTSLCIILYCLHVGYLKTYKWNYSYNIAANVVLGVIQNMMWSVFSFNKYRASGMVWAMWPGFVVAWIMLAMGLEILDFPPFWGYFDAHSLWHLGTVGPTMLWYNFLVKDAQDDIAGQRFKA